MAELSRASGVSIATIKYYLREGLVPPGERTSANQAEYSAAHVDRLRLIRVLREVGEMPVATIGRVLAAVGDATVPVHEMLGMAHHALGGAEGDAEPPSPEAIAWVDAVLARAGWQVAADAPARLMLARAVGSLPDLGRAVDLDVLAFYADHADAIARWELEQTSSEPSREGRLRRVVAGIVVYEQVLVALRRLAQEHHSARRFGMSSTQERGGHGRTRQGEPPEGGPGA